MNKIIEQITTFLQNLTQKEFYQYLAATLAGVGFLIFGILYYTYYTSSDYAEKIQSLNKQAKEVADLVKRANAIKVKEQNVVELFKKNQTFDLRSYFLDKINKPLQINSESLSQQDGPEITGSDGTTQFQEKILPISLKNQTMDRLVKLLQEVYKEPLVYIKALEITGENGKINIDLTLATVQPKETEVAAT